MTDNFSDLLLSNEFNIIKSNLLHFDIQLSF